MPMLRAFTEERHLSVFCLGILCCNIQVGNKDRVAGFLVDRYIEEGRTEEAETFLKTLCGLPVTEAALQGADAGKGAGVATAGSVLDPEAALSYVPVAGEAGERLKSRLEAMRA